MNEIIIEKKNQQNFEETQSYIFFLNHLKKILQLSKKDLDFLNACKSFVSMDVEDRIKLKMILQHNELILQLQDNNQFQLFGLHRQSANDKNIKIIKIAEWLSPIYIWKAMPNTNIQLQVELRQWSSIL